jgi:hypothetical protein
MFVSARIVMAATLLLFLGSAPSCSCHNQIVKRAYPVPTAEDLLAHLAQSRRRTTSFQADSVMDYWVGDERVKGTVLLMGKWGARLRFNALSPTGDSVAADLSCDGIGYKFIDYGANCQLSGPCTEEAIARLLRVHLQPDDFMTFALGSTPVILSGKSSVRWDETRGHEILELMAPDGRFTQTIVLDGRERRWDVLESIVRDARGNVEWIVQNKGFRDVTSADGTTLRAPQKTRFEQPKEKADLVIRWREHVLNPDLPPDKFNMYVPVGLSSC